MQNNSINGYSNPNATRGYFGGKLHSHPRLCEAETKELIKIKTEGRNGFCIRVILSIKLRLTVMSKSSEYRERERQRKRERRRQASEAKREKVRQRARERDEKQRRQFFWEKGCENFAPEKMRNASGHQDENERH